MDIELYDINRHDVDAIKIILSMAMGNPNPEDLNSLLFDFYTRNDQMMFIASENDTVSGIIGIDCSGKPSGYINHLAVLPANRRRGIGRSLIVETAKVLGLSTMELETDQDAVEFYNACGFNSKEIESNYPGIRRFRCVKNMIE
ncbi:MAG: GNAT family N-acetyltransferase [Dehalococcoidales bacterium]|nr:MAG: GNAT family N-acetyltransferase [Dehalococcoidales bacterium]